MASNLINHIAGNSERIENLITVTDTSVNLSGAATDFQVFVEKSETALYSVAGTLALVSGTNWKATFDIAKDVTNSIVPGVYRWRVNVEAAGFRRTPSEGEFRVSNKVN